LDECNILCCYSKDEYDNLLSEEARNTLFIEHWNNWVIWKLKYFPAEEKETVCDDAKHMGQWQTNYENIIVEKDYFLLSCNEFCCLSQSEFITLLPDDIQDQEEINDELSSGGAS